MRNLAIGLLLFVAVIGTSGGSWATSDFGSTWQDPLTGLGQQLPYEIMWRTAGRMPTPDVRAALVCIRGPPRECSGAQTTLPNRPTEHEAR